jgi:hypothetical protein
LFAHCCSPGTPFGFLVKWFFLPRFEIVATAGSREKLLVAIMSNYGNQNMSTSLCVIARFFFARQLLVFWFLPPNRCFFSGGGNFLSCAIDVDRLNHVRKETRYTDESGALEKLLWVIERS